jgi:ABC-2 type transport system ATP-binding protein
MRRRLDLVAKLVYNPPVLLLDEPTTGLDLRSRLAMWEVIGELVSGGTTLPLTTQYLDEANRLADRIAVVDAGRVIAEGTADDLKARIGGERLELVVTEDGDLEVAARVLACYARGEANVRVDPAHRHASATVEGSAKLLSAVVRDLDTASVQLDDLGLRRPTLDDVFLALTGHTMENPTGTERAGGRPDKEVA